MPRRSIATIPNASLDNWENELNNLLSSLKDESLKHFLKEFLTEEELVMLSKRLQLYKMLYKNLPLKEMQQELGVSTETTRLYNHFKDEKSTEFKSIITKIKTLPNKTDTDGNKIANFVELAIKSRSSAKARAKLYQGDLE